MVDGGGPRTTAIPNIGHMGPYIKLLFKKIPTKYDKIVHADVIECRGRRNAVKVSCFDIYYILPNFIIITFNF